MNSFAYCHIIHCMHIYTSIDPIFEDKIKYGGKVGMRKEDQITDQLLLKIIGCEGIGILRKVIYSL
jgi:hypothetical protein